MKNFSLVGFIKMIVAVFLAYMRGKRDGIKKSDAFIKSAEDAAVKSLKSHKQNAKTKQHAVKKNYDAARARLRDK